MDDPLKTKHGRLVSYIPLWPDAAEAVIGLDFGGIVDCLRIARKTLQDEHQALLMYLLELVYLELSHLTEDLPKQELQLACVAAYDRMADFEKYAWRHLGWRVHSREVLPEPFRDEPYSTLFWNAWEVSGRTAPLDAT